MTGPKEGSKMDLWGEAFPPNLVDSAPVAVLRQQAAALTARTQGRVEGVVLKNFSKGSAWASLYAKVPSLEGYMYKLLSVAHPATDNPASPTSLTVHDTFRGGEDWQPIDTMDQFVSWLEEALSSREAHAVIVNLLSYTPDHATA